MIKSLRRTFKANIAEPVFGVQTTGTVRIHSVTSCLGRRCPFHNPSNHHMVDWPMNVRLDRQALVERTCSHGVAHPDPDSLAYFERSGIKYMGIHGCDGCCTETKHAR